MREVAAFGVAKAYKTGQTILRVVPLFSSAVVSSAGAVVSVTRVCTRVEGPT